MCQEVKPHKVEIVHMLIIALVLLLNLMPVTIGPAVLLRELQHQEDCIVVEQ